MFDRINEGRWWDDGLTLVEGCTPVSESCENCWALEMEKRFHKNDNNEIRFMPERLGRIKRKKPKVYSIWNDLFHPSISMSDIFCAFQAFEVYNHNKYLILTKRPERALRFAQHVEWEKRNFNHIWIGTTVENQKRADERIPFLLQIPAAVRFVSVEPMLSSVDLSEYLCDIIEIDDLTESHPSGFQRKFIDEFLEGKRKFIGRRKMIHGSYGHCMNYPDGFTVTLKKARSLDWIIAGGESGANARPMFNNWVTSLQSQCRFAEAAFLFKQWGEWMPLKVNAVGGLASALAAYGLKEKSRVLQCGQDISVKVGKKKAGRGLDGKIYNQYPGVTCIN